MDRTLTYDAVGATRPDAAAWDEQVPGFRPLETTVVIGHGEADWQRACAAVLAWGVKTRSGFAVVAPDGGGAREVRAGEDWTLVARVGPLRVREPVRVVEVVRTEERCGFAYGTRPGHPVSGEEAFVVHRGAGGEVSLTMRSLTRPGTGAWRAAYPALLVAQRVYRRRYARALLTAHPPA